jgi:hypothetical protein
MLSAPGLALNALGCLPRRLVPRGFFRLRFRPSVLDFVLVLVIDWLAAFALTIDWLDWLAAFALTIDWLDWLAAFGLTIDWLDWLNWLAAFALTIDWLDWLAAFARPD